MMNFKRFAIDFSITFVCAFVAAIATTYLYGLVVHGAGVVEWGTSGRLAIVLGIVVPLAQHMRSRKDVPAKQ